MSWEKGLDRGGAWPDDIVQIGEAQEVCPYAVSIDLARQADVVIGDYNYIFSWISAKSSTHSPSNGF